MTTDAHIPGRGDLLVASLLLAMALLQGPCPALVEERVIGQCLKPGELLVGMSRLAEGTEPAGVYATDPQGVARCVVPLAGQPRWSPDRQRFAFTMEGSLCCIDVRSGVLRVIHGQGGLLTQFGAPLQKTQGKALDYDAEGRLICWEWSSGEDRVRIRPIGYEQTKPDGWRWRRLLYEWAGSIGSVSWAPDGASACFEAYDAVPGVGREHARVVIAARDGSGGENVALPSRDGWVTMNPLLCPTSSTVAVDCVDPDGIRRETVLWDVATKHATWLPKPSEFGNWSQGIAWAPDGRHLIVTYGSQPSLFPLLAYAVDCSTRPPRLVTPQVSATPILIDMAWSPDSKEVAVIQGQLGIGEVDALREIVVFSLGDGVRRKLRLPPHLIPETVDW